MKPDASNDFRPRIPDKLAQPIFRLAGLGRRKPTTEVLIAVEDHVRRNHALLKSGPKLRKL